MSKTRAATVTSCDRQRSPLAALRSTFHAAFLSDPIARLFWLKTAIVAAFCIGLALSAPLWIGPRSYPTAPVSSLLSFSIVPVDTVLFAALFGLAAAILIAARPGKLIFAFLGVIAVFGLFDQTRWQPWVFQYSVLLAGLGLFSWNRDDTAGAERALNVARLIIAATYVFSGLQKLNPNFIGHDFPWLLEPITNALPSAREPLHAMGLAAPFIQVAFGVGLLTRRFRRISLVLALAMHALILAMFGPFGHDWNSVIWPWTAAMGVFDVLLFGGATNFSPGDVFRTGRRAFYAGVLVLFAGLPWLSFVNLWDSYLSAALYSGNLTEATLYASDAGKASLPDALAARFVRTSPDTHVLKIQRWAIEDLNVTPYPETRVYRQIARAVCEQSRRPAQFVLLVSEQRLFASRPETGYRCAEL